MSKVAIVTGGATRIGAHISEHLARTGWRVAIHYHSSKESAEELNKKINSISKSIIVKKDFCKANDFDYFFDVISKDLGEPSLLINNASLFLKDNIFSIEEGSLKDQMSVNLFAPILLIKKMLAQSSILERNIINISDGSINLRHSKSFLSYSLSKLALLNLMSLVFAQSKGSDFRINTISPGFVLKKDNESLADFEDIVNRSNKKNITTMDEIVKAVEKILLDQSIDGQNIEI